MATVLGDAGPISLPQDTDLQQVAVLATGEVQVGDTVAGKLRLGYAEPHTLEAVGNNRYKTDEIAASEDVEVAQGYQEQSTVNAVKAMVDLIDTHRSFDANMKLVSSYKELDQEAIQLLK